jgi:hypothetical protein
MDSSLSRQTFFSLSIIPGQPLHRLTGSMRRDLSVVVTSMLPALPTESWLASEAYRRRMNGRRGNEGVRFPVAGRSAQPSLAGQASQPVALGVVR